jgi:hypothetical protein
MARSWPYGCFCNRYHCCRSYYSSRSYYSCRSYYHRSRSYYSCHRWLSGSSCRVVACCVEFVTLSSNGIALLFSKCLFFFCCRSRLVVASFILSELYYLAPCLLLAGCFVFFDLFRQPHGGWPTVVMAQVSPPLSVSSKIGCNATDRTEEE